MKQSLKRKRYILKRNKKKNRLSNVRSRGRKSSPSVVKPVFILGILFVITVVLVMLKTPVLSTSIVGQYTYSSSLVTFTNDGKIKAENEPSFNKHNYKVVNNIWNYVFPLNSDQDGVLLIQNDDQNWVAYSTDLKISGNDKTLHIGDNPVANGAGIGSIRNIKRKAKIPAEEKVIANYSNGFQLTKIK